jgi:hypothetical protein
MVSCTTTLLSFLLQNAAHSIPTKWEIVDASMSDLLNSGWQLLGRASNDFNVTLNKVMDAGASLRSAQAKLSATNALKIFDISISFIDSQLQECQSETELKSFEESMINSASIAKAINIGFDYL